MTNNRQYIAIIGIDSGNRSRGAKFQIGDAEAARKAAQLMELRTALGKNDEQKALLNKLADGKIFASGKGLVPLIKRPLYDLLVQKLELEPATKTDVANATPPIIRPLPQAWLDLKVGSTVCAPDPQDPQINGWWPAVITAVKGDQIILRWIDGPKQKPATFSRSAVAILPPAKAK